MERKIGDTFEYKGHKLMVVEQSGYECEKCFFYNKPCSLMLDIIGLCCGRTDKKCVTFIKQPQELNLCEILKNCPMGESFWSPLYGDVKLYNVDHKAKKICVTTKTDSKWWINPDATITIAGVISPEIMLYPSREQRDWSKFTAPWYKKEKFDPKTLKPFDKIITRIDKNGFWCCELFSFIEEGTNLVKGCGGYYKYCVPYNDDTMYLLSTANEAPDFYRYWED